MATTFAAYEKALADGKTRPEAIAYAKEVNRKANFSYGVEDAPNMFRRTGPIGKIALQFQKYPVKQLEVMADMLSSKTTKEQKAAFWLPYFFAVGLMGFIPAGGWLDDLVKKLSGYSPKDLVQSTAMKWAGNDATKKEIAKVAMYGAGAIANIDTSKRAGLTDLMPQDFTSFIIGPTGSTIRNTFNYATDGEYANALRSVSPGVYNIYAAAIAGESKGKRGRTNTVYEDAWDIIIRGAGFKSVDEAVQVDIKQILNNEQTRYTKERQKNIDALVEDPYDKDAQKRARELGITGEQVRNERKKKKQTYKERTESGMTERQKKKYKYLVDFAK